MLGREELAHWSAAFGVADEQVRRDHLISHVLAALGELEEPTLVFYGGTALARTYLTRFRLSEDVDLLAAPRPVWAERLERHLHRALRRHFGPVRWEAAPTTAPERTGALLGAGDLVVRVQLLALDQEQARWPVERRSLEMRYADVPPTTLAVPTRPAFVALKTLAWADRRAPRDLADLAALAELGALDPSAADLVAEMAGWRPQPAMFEQLPESTRTAWPTDLAHQMPRTPTACGPYGLPGPPPATGSRRPLLGPASAEAVNQPMRAYERTAEELDGLPLSLAVLVAGRD